LTITSCTIFDFNFNFNTYKSIMRLDYVKVKNLNFSNFRRQPCGESVADGSWVWGLFVRQPTSTRSTSYLVIVRTNAGQEARVVIALAGHPPPTPTSRQNCALHRAGLILYSQRIQIEANTSQE
jgi:hypothetical protein